MHSLGDMMIVFTNISDGKDVNIEDMKLKDNHAKYDKLSKEHELLKEKLDSVMKELSDEKEKKKSNVKIEEKSTDLQNSEHSIFFFFSTSFNLFWSIPIWNASVKKKLEEVVTLRENERKVWDQEKTALLEEKDKLKSKLLSLSAEKLKVYNETVQLKKDLGNEIIKIKKKFFFQF